MSDNLPAATETPGKPRPITKKIRAAVDALVHGDARSITEAANRAGLTRSHLSRELGKQHISAFLRDKVLRNLAINAARAGAVKTELLDSPNEMVRDRASSFVLGLAGIKPEESPSVSVNIEVKAGYVIDLTPAPGEIIDAKVVSHV
jgi:hypothetical protein